MTGDQLRLSIAPSREAEIVEELTQHLDDRWHELMARGETPDDAARIARTEFNGARLEALLGTLRQAHWSEPPPPGPSRAFSLDSLLIDLRHTLRALRATPSFTLGALLVLALGTGATTASSPSSTRWCFARCRFRTPIESSHWGSEGTPTRVVSADRQVARQAPNRWAVGRVPSR